MSVFKKLAPRILDVGGAVLEEPSKRTTGGGGVSSFFTKKFDVHDYKADES